MTETATVADLQRQLADMTQRKEMYQGRAKRNADHMHDLEQLLAVKSARLTIAEAERETAIRLAVRLEQEYVAADSPRCGNHDHAGHGCHDRPHISIDPAVYSGQPVITWRIPPEIPCEQWWSGHDTVEGITDNWPSITLPRFLVAAWYLGRFGSRTWRKRWGKWADEANGHLWTATGYENCPLPPQATERQETTTTEASGE